MNSKHNLFVINQACKHSKSGKSKTKDELMIESNKLLEKYKQHVPVLIATRTPALKLKKCKYLVPRNITIGQFISIIRKNLKMKSEEGLFVFINNNIPVTSKTIEDTYNEYKDDSGFLCVIMSLENTFG